MVNILGAVGLRGSTDDDTQRDVWGLSTFEFRRLLTRAQSFSLRCK